VAWQRRRKDCPTSLRLTIEYEPIYLTIKSQREAPWRPSRSKSVSSMT
jgi:hypothetical protein